MAEPFGRPGSCESVHLVRFSHRRSARPSTSSFRPAWSWCARSCRWAAGPHGCEAQSAAAAGQGRSHSGRPTSTAPGWKSIAALVSDELNVKEVEYHAEGRSVHQLYGAARFEAAWPAVGQATAGLEGGAGRGRRGELLGELEHDGHVRFDLPDGPVTLDARRSAGPLAGKAGLGRGTRAGRASSCCRPS